MSDAVLHRQSVLNDQAVLDRQALDRRFVRSGVVRSRVVRSRQGRPYRVEPRRPFVEGDLRRPAAGTVAYGSARSRVSRAEHAHRGSEVGWRMVLASVVITAGVLVGLVGVAQLAATESMGSSGATEVIHVREGESLAVVAATISPERPVAQVVERIMELNAMSNSAVYPGQTLIVPASGTR
ncbi:LysM peptidoglycan-binding domain-containing protein [Rhodococcus tibetensis]|uniref:LysM peptidoglycan-binding domain-containing protein n=1 Tax=Rhodococcus tibetensis TaxID=2965064 RepID=A0ABT1QAZ6_9NOCA|nr:LysM peptidoglycan-binding domain-containing protein [Rhodococcus sp. FXJ9.536]MCQ4119451.1 LysM peptidoglycan-binding domain-containing protein [Rhodococcus sp. FXJ9.536]